jgi:hypothetical protein
MGTEIPGGDESTVAVGLVDQGLSHPDKIEAGGLMSYGESLAEMYRHAAPPSIKF